MSLLEVGLLVAAALISLGAASFALRRSAHGLLVAVQLSMGGAILAVVAASSLAGRSSSLGQVVAVGLVVVAAAAAVAILAIAAAPRARRAPERNSS